MYQNGILEGFIPPKPTLLRQILIVFGFAGAPFAFIPAASCGDSAKENKKRVKDVKGKMLTAKNIRNTLISIFIILWIIVFHYESIRYFYLNPIFKRSLPKMKFLFPPAGWIMFYNVDDSYGLVEVLGVKDNILQVIDPHDILRTRT